MKTAHTLHYKRPASDWHEALPLGCGTFGALVYGRYDVEDILLNNDTFWAGFGLQALTEESLTTSYEAYIETKCKLQDVYDEDAAKCLDIIFNGVVYDIVFICDIGGLGKLMWSSMAGLRTNTYSRTFKSAEKIASKQIAEIRKTYEELGQ